MEMSQRLNAAKDKRRQSHHWPFFLIASIWLR